MFEEAIKLFFAKYENDMQKIVNGGKDISKNELSKYINYIDYATQDFRKKYLAKLHWSILGAIREYTLTIMKKFISQILNEYYGHGIIADKDIDLTVCANLIAYGVGGSILYQSQEIYESQKTAIMNNICDLLK